MKKYWECERCEKLVEEPQGQNEFELTPAGFVYQRGQSEEELPESKKKKRWNVCDECRQEIQKFIETKPRRALPEREIQYSDEGLLDVVAPATAALRRVASEGEL